MPRACQYLFWDIDKIGLAQVLHGVKIPSQAPIIPHRAVGCQYPIVGIYKYIGICNNTLSDGNGVKNVEKILEYTGTFLAAVGFSLLSFGYYSSGFAVGIASCILLVPLFKITGQHGLFMLQCFFLLANINGVWNA